MKPKVTLLLGTLVLMLLGASPAGATLPGKNGPLLISASHGPLPDLPGRPIYISRIYRVGLDGTSSSLKIPGYINYAPALSPDGSKLAFVRNPGDQIWIKELRNNSEPVQLTQEIDGTYRWGPVFTPDGESLIYSTSFEAPKAPPYAELTQTFFDTGLKEESDDGWTHYSDTDVSPDGELIAFTSYAEGETEIRLADGVQYPSWPLDVPVSASGPSFSPDGRKVAFAGRVDDGSRQVFVSSVDGTRVRQLTKGLSKWDVTFSPDGRKLAFIEGDPTIEPESRVEKIKILDLESSKSVELDSPGKYSSIHQWPRVRLFQVLGYRANSSLLRVRVFSRGHIRVTSGGKLLAKRKIGGRGTHGIRLRIRKMKKPLLRVRFSPVGALPRAVNYKIPWPKRQGRVASSSR